MARRGTRSHASNGRESPGDSPRDGEPHQGVGLTAARSWWLAKTPILKFAALFTLVLASLYSLTLTPTFQRNFFPTYLHFNADIASRVLKLIGHETTVSQRVVTSPRFSVDISRGCDAIEPCFLFLAAVLAFPASWKRKVPGLLLGAVLLAAINLVRIVSLYLVGIYRPRAFDFVHLEAWQVGFILLAVVLWLLWIIWALPVARPTIKQTP